MSIAPEKLSEMYQKMATTRAFEETAAKLFTLGKFYLSTPPSIDLRCDLHPRWSRDGKYVCIDSAHENAQRQIYLLDVSRIVSSVD